MNDMHNRMLSVSHDLPLDGLQGHTTVIARDADSALLCMSLSTAFKRAGISQEGLCMYCRACSHTGSWRASVTCKRVQLEDAALCTRIAQVHVRDEKLLRMRHNDQREMNSAGDQQVAHFRYIDEVSPSWTSVPTC